MSTTLGNTVEEVVRGYMSKLTELRYIAYCEGIVRLTEIVALVTSNLSCIV